MHRRRRLRAAAAVTAFAALLATGCATLQQMAALRRVDFRIDRVSEARLAGVDVRSIRSYQDLTPSQLAALGIALSRNALPLEFRLHVTASNPEDNPTARLLAMDWALLLEDRETVSGTLEGGYTLEPGSPTDVPVDIRLDLLDFFERSGPDLVELALAVAGRGGDAPDRIRLRAHPTIDTPLGPIRYPEPVTITVAAP